MTRLRLPFPLTRRSQASAIVGMVINSLLPEAVQLDEVALFIRFGKQRGLKQRELQRRLTAAWAAVGYPDGKDLKTWPVEEAARTRLLQSLSIRTP